MTMTYRYLRKQPKKAATIGTSQFPYSFVQATMAGDYIAVAGLNPSEGSTGTTPRGAYAGIFQVAPDGSSVTWAEFTEGSTTVRNIRPLSLRRNSPTPVNYVLTVPVGMHSHFYNGEFRWFSNSATPGITTASGANAASYTGQFHAGSVIPGTYPAVGGGGGAGGNAFTSGMRYASLYSNGTSYRFSTQRRAIVTPIGSAEYYTSNAQVIGGLQQYRNNTYQNHTLCALQVLVNDGTPWAITQQVLAGAAGSTTRWDIWMDRQTPGGGEQSPVYNCSGLPNMTVTEMQNSAYFFQDGVFFIAYGNTASSYTYQGNGVFVLQSTMPISTYGKIHLCRLSGNRILLASNISGSYVRFTPSQGITSAGDQPAFPGVTWASAHSSGNVIAVRAAGNPTTFEILSVPE